MQKWVISDHHFGHENIIEYSKRPFKNVDQMDEYMIQQHNNTVKERDKVYILGDFALCHRMRIEQIAAQLNGYLILILGNHDRRRGYKQWLQIGFNEVYKEPIILKSNLILSHEPLMINKDCQFRNIHGHLHNYVLDVKRYMNVSVETTDYKPINLDELIKTVSP